ncbi:NAD(P)H-binding protein [Streptomyces sp. NPDC001315]|uniref:NAD(P)H-binding protein n=1 Tax=Streptomyces sp. NPDC001315 TaxID=3364562 RepID=UPI0036C317B2
MILVTGATGTVGGQVAGLLAGTRPLRILARRRSEVAAAGPDAEVVRGEYADHGSLLRALTGVRAAFLVTNDIAEPDDERFVAAARASGVRHVVKLSAYAVADPQAQDLITRKQRQNERILRDSGLDWTFLRPRAFMSNALAWAPRVRSDGVVRALHGSAPDACVDPRDIAEVAVRALTGPGHEGKAYQLTGPEAITPQQQTACLSEALGRPLRFQELTADQARSQLLRRYPPVVAEALMRSAQRRLEGGKSQVVSTVRDVTGSPARDFRAWATDHAEAFA